MSRSLDSIRRGIRSGADAARWACVMEATAPKVGNVHPGQSFCDLSYTDFIVAAWIAADKLQCANTDTPFSCLVLQTIQETRLQTRSNVNLGILLLIGPLAQVVRQHSVGSRIDWLTEVPRLLARQTHQDALNIFESIRISSAGGLGEVDTMDVHNDPGDNRSETELDLIEAMDTAAGRDAIARQYSSGFSDFFNRVVPIVHQAIEKQSDILMGIATAHIELLRSEPDTLIARKCGLEVACEVQRRARQLDTLSPEAVDEFDQFLRSDKNRLNPGTTADLIAAALFVLFIDPRYETRTS
ncbi:ATP:dephospho-CoA triphosphoribosyl transferase [Planctomycetes bacterium CA13]|uniref:ATP:dephospho-CoA triphosphoribosyl transferase n=1 Tax=Novipirellula herctigrandis TaxID=2527986 RepID=A0A5C5Z3Q0_9BACT|nr:ATP:dephospho-CoA triphosphoribosyl transferase [Planctomycetes bacterium CA13]